MFPFLTLDQSTLFYWTLSDASRKKQKHSSAAINEWASEIPRNVRPGFPSRAPTKSTSSRAKSSARSLTGHRLSTASSVLTKNVKITRYQPSDLIKVKAEPALASDVVPETQANGGLSDNDEMRGEERLAAINSPPKGKKRVNSEVSFLY